MKNNTYNKFLSKPKIGQLLLMFLKKDFLWRKKIKSWYNESSQKFLHIPYGYDFKITDGVIRCIYNCKVSLAKHWN